MSLKYLLTIGNLIIQLNFLLCQTNHCDRIKLLKDSTSFYITRLLSKADSFANIYEDYAMRYGNSDDCADAVLTKGTIQNSLFQFEPARKKIIESLKYYEERNDTIGIIRAKLALGMNHNFLNEFSESVELSREVVKLCIALNDSDLLYRGYYGLGRVFGWSQYARKNRDTLNLAIFYFKKAQRFKSPKHDSIYYSPLYRGFGDAYMKLGDYNEALKYFEINLRQQIAQKVYGGIINSAFNIAIIYKGLGKPEKAIFYLKLGDKYADGSNNAGLHSLYQELYRYYLTKHDYKNAFKYYEKFVEVNERIIIADKEGAVSKLSKLYQTEKQESQIKKQQAEIILKEVAVKNQKKITYILLSVLSVISIAGFFYYRLYKENRASSKKNALLLKEQNHRVKNNLQVISALLSLQANRIESTDARKAIEDSQLRVQAMGMIHKKLYGDNIVEIDMKTFIPELAECILPVFGFHNGSVQHLIESSIENLNVDKAVPVGLILNELLTNSCKYAFSKNEKPYFKISLFKKPDNSISLTYQDNGPGFDYEQEQKKGSFGLKLIELQSRQIFGEYSWEIKNGTTFSLIWKN